MSWNDSHCKNSPYAPRSIPPRRRPSALWVLLIAALSMLTLTAALAGLPSTEKGLAPLTDAPAADERLTDRTGLSFTSSGVTSTYHLYAEGLNWTEPVGMMIYTDGSGEYGLAHPRSNYLLGGKDGLVAVAKRHNMVLVTPRAPGGGCSDGEGVCWYGASSGISPAQKAEWAEDLVSDVQSDYPIDTSRIAVGGYSSGAQMMTQHWIPSGAAERTMQAGVVVSISYGGAPRRSVQTSEVFKRTVHLNWNTGSEDAAYTSGHRDGVKRGLSWYADQGFDTSLDVELGVGHGRSRAFGRIMEAQIVEHL
ncbi:MAG: hypothetical protein WBG89_12775 [Ornithinimicrobium sp.]